MEVDLRVEEVQIGGCEGFSKQYRTRKLGVDMGGAKRQESIVEIGRLQSCDGEGRRRESAKSCSDAIMSFASSPYSLYLNGAEMFTASPPAHPILAHASTLFPSSPFF